MSYPPNHRRVSHTSTLAVVSLVSGILTWFVLPFIGAIVAVVCGHLARSEIRRAPHDAVIEGDGMAIAGLVLGYVHLVCSLLLIFFVLGVLFLGLTYPVWMPWS